MNKNKNIEKLKKKKITNEQKQRYKEAKKQYRMTDKQKTKTKRLSKRIYKKYD